MMMITINRGKPCRGAGFSHGIAIQKLMAKINGGSVKRLNHSSNQYYYGVEEQ